MSKHNNQYCVNPETNRNIRIGGKTWMRLVKTNKLAEGTYKHPNVGYQTKETYEDSALDLATQDTVLRQLEEQKQRMIDNNQVPVGKTLHIKPPRKGFRKRGKIVYRDHNLTAHEASKNTADAAMNVIDQIQNGEIEVPANMNREEAHEYLQGLIFNKMLSGSNPKNSFGTKFKNMKLTPKNIQISKPPLIRQIAEPAAKLTKTKKYKTIAPKKISSVSSNKMKGLHRSGSNSTRIMAPMKAPRRAAPRSRPVGSYSDVQSERPTDNIVYEDYDGQSESDFQYEYEDPVEASYETEQEPDTEYEDANQYDSAVEYVYE